MIDFTKQYDRRAWLNFLEDSFLPDDFSTDEKELPYSGSYTKEVTKLGECQSLQLTVFEIKHTSINDARVGLSKEVFTLVRDFTSHNKALVLFVPQDSINNESYRFSFVEFTPVVDEKGKTTREISNPRRYSFLLGFNCKMYTPTKYLVTEGRIQQRSRKAKKFSLIEDLRYRFSVDALTKEFFDKLFFWYDKWAVDIVKFPVGSGKNAQLPKTPDKDENRLHLIRLITRLIFVWFLKHKEDLLPSWLFNIEDLKKTIVDFDEHDNKSGSYYNAVIQNLFFATLNREIDQRIFFDEENGRNSYSIKSIFRDHIDKPMIKIPHEDFIKKFETIPFLNGGLFECLDYRDASEEQRYIDGFSRESKRAAFVPNCLFWGDNDKHKEQGIFDIFSQYNFTIEENSPQDIDIALDPELLGKVFENLLATYDEKTEKSARKESGSFYTPREVVNYMVNSSLKAYLKSKLENIKEGIDDIDKLLDMIFSDNMSSIFLSIQKKAVLIREIKECKILDPACGSGAFPMGILNKLIFILNRIDPANETWENDYNRKLYLIENCIYGVDIQPIAIQISRLRFFISLITEQSVKRSVYNYGILPLPNLETKFVAANTLIKLSKNEERILPDLEIEKIQQQLLEIRHKHFLAKNTEDKKRIREEDTQLSEKLVKLLDDNRTFSPESVMQVASWNPYKPNVSAPFFDMYWMFGVKSGFNVIIGNPPYFVIKNDEKLKSQYEKIYHYLKSGRVNIYQLFMGCSAYLLSEHGILTFIHPKTLLSDAYLSATRNFLLSYFPIFNIINIVSRTDTFPAVLQSVVVSLWNKNKDTQCHVSEIFKKSDFENIDYLSLQKEDIVSPHKTLLVSKDSIAYKIEKKLRNIETIPLNFITGSIEWNKNTVYLSGVKKATSKRLIYGENIQRFYFTEFNSRADMTFLNNKARVPILAETAIFTQRTTAVEQLYRVIASIVNPETFDTAIVTENNTNVFICKDTQIAYYVLGILSSKLIDFYFRLFNSNTHVSSTELNRLPIIKADKKQFHSIITIVENICGIKANKPDVDTSELERELNNTVYCIYNLLYDEVKVIEPDFPLNEKEYEIIKTRSK